jgi:hypothetical protein
MASNSNGQRQADGLIVLQLNEVNFDLVQRYLSQQTLPGFSHVMSKFDRVETFAETKYEELEPWIQWVSAHSGLRYGEHRIFRLGDAINSRVPQIFELMEQQGLTVGAISPMNARNELQHPAYFIPDPWTATASDGSGYSRRLTAMLQQTVNENAQGRIGIRSLLTIAEAVVRSFNLKGTVQLLKLITHAKGKHWIKALVLDQLIHLVHVNLFRQKSPDVSFVFLNAGAHIQHHYLFNSPHANTAAKNPAWYAPPDADPVLDMLQVYDRILLDYLELSAQHGSQLIVATGLTQVAYDRVKFYYRLRHHAQFLGMLGVAPKRVLPRMTRDFEALFDDAGAAQRAATVLRDLRMVRDGVPLFSEIEERGASLFVTLSYPNEILPADMAEAADGTLVPMLQQVAFVAVKNGMHSTKGFAFFSPDSTARLPAEPVHVSALFGLTLGAAGIAPASNDSATAAARKLPPPHATQERPEQAVQAK